MRTSCAAGKLPSAPISARRRETKAWLAPEMFASLSMQSKDRRTFLRDDRPHTGGGHEALLSVGLPARAVPSPTFPGTTRLALVPGRSDFGFRLGRMRRKVRLILQVIDHGIILRPAIDGRAALLRQLSPECRVANLPCVAVRSDQARRWRLPG